MKITKKQIDTLHLSDIYSLMLFVMYKIWDVPEYALISRLCFLLDGANMTRLLTYFAGKTITFPTEKEMTVMTQALLLYQYVNIDGQPLTEAVSKLKDLTGKQKDDAVNLYLKILPIMSQYKIDTSGLSKDGEQD